MVAEATLGCEGQWLCWAEAGVPRNRLDVLDRLCQIIAFIKGWALPLPSAGPTPD